MELGSLASAMSAQAAMGQLLVKVLDQTQQLIQQQAAITIDNAAVTPSVEGVGENIDVVA
jgi:hypothetical protein